MTPPNVAAELMFHIYHN